MEVWVCYFTSGRKFNDIEPKSVFSMQKAQKALKIHKTHHQVISR